MRTADLIGAKLSAANLFEADLRAADLRGAILSGAILSGAILSGAILSGATLSGAVWDDDTVWPEGFTPPDERGVEPEVLESVGDLTAVTLNEAPTLEEVAAVTKQAESVLGVARNMYDAGDFPEDDGTAEDVRVTIQSLTHALHPTTGRPPNPQAVEGLLQTLDRAIAEANGDDELVAVIDGMTDKGPTTGR